MKPLDIEIMKRLGTRVNLIPVVAKADTMTPNDLVLFKQRIREVVAAQGIRIYVPPVDSEDDPASTEHARSLADAMPFSIIGSTDDVVNKEGKTVKGREYLWGVAEGSYRLTSKKKSIFTDFLQLKMRTTATSASCALS